MSVQGGIIHTPKDDGQNHHCGADRHAVSVPACAAGLDQIAETMGGLIVTVFLVYCAKSFFEKKEEQRMRLQEQYLNENDVVAPVQPEREDEL